MATPLLAEIARRWIEDGTVERLIQVQRDALALRHGLIADTLGPYILNNHANSLSTWLRIPAHWRTDSLVSVLRRRGIAVTAPEPFAVQRNNCPPAVRLCVGADIDDREMHRALLETRKTFEQQPLSNDFI